MELSAGSRPQKLYLCRMDIHVVSLTSIPRVLVWAVVSNRGDKNTYIVTFVGIRSQRYRSRLLSDNTPLGERPETVRWLGRCIEICARIIMHRPRITDEIMQKPITRGGILARNKKKQKTKCNSRNFWETRGIREETLRFS